MLDRTVGFADYPRRMPPARLLRRVVAALAVTAVVLTGCAPAKHQVSAPTPAPSVAEADHGDLASFYGQQLEWSTCDEGQCAKVRVPLDYDDPAGTTIQLALARHKAPGTPLGSLLVNPGGPGASGVDFLGGFVGEATDDLLKNFDIVSFDPRGVQRSSPVRCVDDAEMDRITAIDPPDGSDESLQDAIDESAKFSKECVNTSGEVPAHIDTVSAAKDLDIMRSALGDASLYYLGFSYGTKLGATYAALFPQQAGRLVLDGALDPTLTDGDVEEGQAGGFEKALRAYVADCQAGSKCPLSGSVDDGMQQIGDLLDRARKQPLQTTDGRPLTQALAFTGIALTLYSQSYWSALTDGLNAAIHEGDGTLLLSYSDAYYDRGADGTYTTNSTEAFRSITCLDERSDPDFDAMRTQAKQISKVAPTVGQFFSYGGTTCADWAVPEVGGLKDYSAQGAPPIVVVGTTNDPATPYAWAEKLATTLSSGVLLTYEGEGHTAYRSSNTCIANAVDSYLIGGTVPADGTRC